VSLEEPVERTYAEPMARRRGNESKKSENWAKVKKSMANFKKLKRGTTTTKGGMSIVKADI
jgi:hypothetical protein